MSKKLLLILFFFSLSTESFSEEYICSYISNDEGYSITYERQGDIFIGTMVNGTVPFGIYKIVEETNKVLYLFGSPLFDENPFGFFIIIHKENMKYSRNWIILGRENPKETEGKCVVRG